MADKATYKNVYLLSECEISKVPTQKDIKATRKLLKDFQIVVVDIPKFKTVSELNRWKKSVIQALL